MEQLKRSLEFVDVDLELIRIRKYARLMDVDHIPNYVKAIRYVNDEHEIKAEDTPEDLAFIEKLTMLRCRTRIDIQIRSLYEGLGKMTLAELKDLDENLEYFLLKKEL